MSFIAIIISLVATNNEAFRNHFEARLKQTAVETAANGIIQNTPLWISGLEVFDAAAVAFFYHHPQYIYTGTGPNTINIPSSPYLSAVNKSTYRNKIDSIPHMGVLQLFSRSGLIGLFLVILGIIKSSKRLKRKNKELNNLYLLLLLFSAIVMTPFFFFTIGVFSNPNNLRYK